jgi:hypothetical protein
MMKVVSAMGARCKHMVFQQFTHTQRACLRMFASVGRDLLAGFAWQAWEPW